MLTFIHAADFHLDSPFSSLTDLQAMERRREYRSQLLRLAEYVNKHNIDFVLLAGDLFDASPASRDTGEQLSRALGTMRAKVFAAPGNHDWYGPRSPWETIEWPENVTVFRENSMTAAEVPEWNLTVYGAAFTGPQQTEGLLKGFTVPKNGLSGGGQRQSGQGGQSGQSVGGQGGTTRLHIGLLHGEITARDSVYNPIRQEEIAKSGLHYLALGHIHKRGNPVRYGRTVCAWPGCIEGRGFDETGEKGFYRGTIDEQGEVSLSFVPFSRRCCQILTVDVTDRNPLDAAREALEDGSPDDLARILFTGETGEAGVDLHSLREDLAGRRYVLELRDFTVMRQDLWARSGEDTLRGLFLRELREKLNGTEDEAMRRRITLAARMGLAALDRRDRA